MKAVLGYQAVLWPDRRIRSPGGSQELGLMHLIQRMGPQVIHIEDSYTREVGVSIFSSIIMELTGPKAHIS